MSDTTRLHLIGYANPWSVAPGERIGFFVGTELERYQASLVRLIHTDPNPAGPGVKIEPIPSTLEGIYTGVNQPIHRGSFIEIETKGKLNGLEGFTLACWIYPTMTDRGQKQAILSCWNPQTQQGFKVFLGDDGSLGLQVGDGRTVEVLITHRPLRSRTWYFIAATYDNQSGEVCLWQRPQTSWPSDPSDLTLRRTFTTAPRPASNPSDAPPLLIGAGHLVWGGSSLPAAQQCFDGKIENPALWSAALTEAELSSLMGGADPFEFHPQHLLAGWDFAAEGTISTDQVRDLGGLGLHGRCHNTPARAVTSHAWDGSEDNFRHAPHQYAAIHFHHDDLEDAGWQESFSLSIPSGMRSGVYAVRLEGGTATDLIPFFVRPPRDRATAPLAVLLPTYNYLAYGNESNHAAVDWNAEGLTDRAVTPDPLDHYLAEHPEFGLSLYDHHADGSGVFYGSRLRPLVTLRPTMLHYLLGSPRHLGADLYLLDWLEAKGFAYDLITDEDLHHEGRALLERYRVVMTGSHPEYTTLAMLEALEGYRDGGGRLIYLGGNGFYWVTSVHPEKPHLIEVRRGFSGVRAWESAPGEVRHSTTGEIGGLWRQRGRPPNRLVGVGMAAQGWDSRSPGFARRREALESEVAWVFEGVDPDAVIGDFGLVMGGAVGDEIDRLDYALGTPPQTVWLASSTHLSDYYQLVVEDVLITSPNLGGSRNPKVRSDMVLLETAGGGMVFSVGSMIWSGSLSHNNYTNNVSQITENVLGKFLRVTHRRSDGQSGGSEIEKIRQ